MFLWSHLMKLIWHVLRSSLDKETNNNSLRLQRKAWCLSTLLRVHKVVVKDITWTIFSQLVKLWVFDYSYFVESRIGKWFGKTYLVCRCLSPRPHYPGEIWKRCFDSENASNVFRPHFVGEIWKRNNHWSFWICVWGNPEVIILEKLHFENVFLPH